MARISTVIAAVLIALTTMAQQGVVDTPFWEGADSVWAYTYQIGYTENRRIVVDTIQIGIPSYPLQRIRRCADNPNDGSSVMIEEEHSQYTLQPLIEVRYTWTKNKNMPKGLPKVQQMQHYDTYGEYILTCGQYNNHYFMSLLGNRITGPRGVSYIDGDCSGGHHHGGGGHHHHRR